MKKYKNLVIIGTIFALSLIITVHSKNNLLLDSNTRYGKIEQTLKSSGFLDLSGTPISIIGDGSWGEAAANEPWCEGSGLEGDPYVIENVVINGNGIGDCIYIQDSDEDARCCTTIRPPPQPAWPAGSLRNARPSHTRF